MSLAGAESSALLHISQNSFLVGRFSALALLGQQPSASYVCYVRINFSSVAMFSDGAKAARTLALCHGYSALQRRDAVGGHVAHLSGHCSLSRGTDRDVEWDGSISVAFHKSFTAYVPNFRAGHFSSVIAHFEFCDNCKRWVSLSTDGHISAIADNDVLSGFDGQPSAVKLPVGPESAAVAKKRRYSAGSEGQVQDERCLH